VSAVERQLAALLLYCGLYTIDGVNLGWPARARSLDGVSNAPDQAIERHCGCR
jgi:hypothetical protein